MEKEEVCWGQVFFSHTSCGQTNLCGLGLDQILVSVWTSSTDQTKTYPVLWLNPRPWTLHHRADTMRGACCHVVLRERLFKSWPLTFVPLTEATMASSGPKDRGHNNWSLNSSGFCLSPPLCLLSCLSEVLMNTKLETSDLRWTSYPPDDQQVKLRPSQLWPLLEKNILSSSHSLKRSHAQRQENIFNRCPDAQ